MDHALSEIYLRVMTTTSNLEVPLAPPSWEKYVCQAYFEETNLDQSKRGFIAFSYSFFLSEANVYLLIICFTDLDFLALQVQKGTIALGVDDGQH